MAIDNRTGILSGDSHQSKSRLKNPDCRKQGVTCYGEKNTLHRVHLDRVADNHRHHRIVAQACCDPLYQKPMNSTEHRMLEQVGLASNIYSDDHDGHVPTFAAWLYRISEDLTSGSL
jgi:hypothetical protein